MFLSLGLCGTPAQSKLLYGVCSGSVMHRTLAPHQDGAMHQVSFAFIKAINEALTRDNWDVLLRLVATIKLKENTASDIFRRLNSYSRQHASTKRSRHSGRSSNHCSSCAMLMISRCVRRSRSSSTKSKWQIASPAQSLSVILVSSPR